MPEITATPNAAAFISRCSSDERHISLHGRTHQLAGCHLLIRGGNHSHTCPHTLMQVRHAAREHINTRFAGAKRGLKDRVPAHRKASPQRYFVLELPFKRTIVPDKLITLHDLSLSLIWPLPLLPTPLHSEGLSVDSQGVEGTICIHLPSNRPR